MVKGYFVTSDRPFLFPVKREITVFSGESLLPSILSPSMTNATLFR